MTAPTDLQKALGASHVLVAQVRSVPPAGGVSTAIPYRDGHVDVDATRAIRRILYLTIPDPRWLPVNPTDVLSPYSAQLRVRQGVEFADGTSETVSLGVFRVQSILGDERRGPLELIGYSLESAVVDDRFESPRQASGPSCVALIAALIQESYPGAVVVVDTAADAPVPRTTWQEDRWGAVAELATAIGCEVYCDADGQFRISDVVDPLTATPTQELRAGEGGTLKSVSRGYSRDGVYNCVVARSSAVTSEVPIQGVWRDTDPLSPTLWGGVFRKVTRYYSSPLLTTVGQCELAAKTIGLKSTGLARSVTLEAVPRPDLDVGKATRVIPDPVNAPNGEIHVLDSFPIRLRPGGRRWVAATRASTYNPEAA